MNNKHFTELLERYLAEDATTAQEEELMQLIKSGMYDDQLKENIYNCLIYDNPAANIDSNRAQELLERILDSEKHTAELITVIRGKKITWRPLAVAAVLFGIIAVATWYIIPVKRSMQAPVVKRADIEKPLKPVPVAHGKKYIRLPDGSTVLLNEGSRLEFPDAFEKNTREVTLIGEGYFDIKHDPAKQFIVHTGKVITTVLGTAFNIKAYPGQKEVTVTVTRGRVKVGDATKTFGIAAPNESIAINTLNETFIQEKVNAEEVLQWKKQYLVLDDISMQEAAVLISAKYNVIISFSNDNLKHCRLRATFLNDEAL